MFDMGSFERAQFEPRTKRVPVPALADFFSEDEAPEWVVRSLTANELAKAASAQANRKTIDNILEAVAKSGDQVTALRDAMGLGSDTPGEVVKRLEMLVSGSVEPEITLPNAIKLAENFPIEFTLLTNEITVITGLGAEMVKPEAALPQTAS